MATQPHNTPSGVTATGLPIPHPRVVELIERRELRKKVERAVSRLIAILDELDSDPEAEPWLGSMGMTCTQSLWAAGTTDDRETVDEDGDVLDRGEFDASDIEPSLGAPENVDQNRWAQGGRRDLELVGEENAYA